jgi:hypothetical protein
MAKMQGVWRPAKRFLKLGCRFLAALTHEQRKNIKRTNKRKSMNFLL